MPWKWAAANNHLDVYRALLVPGSERYLGLPPDPKSRLVLLALVAHADRETGECWPSVQTLTVATGLSKRSVLRALADLEELELIVRRRRQRSRGESNRYVVRLFIGANETAKTADEGSSATMTPMDAALRPDGSPTGASETPDLVSGQVPNLNVGSVCVAPKQIKTTTGDSSREREMPYYGGRDTEATCTRADRAKARLVDPASVESDEEDPWLVL